MSLADRIEGAKLTDEGIDSICIAWVGSIPTGDDYEAVAQAQHAKDKSELLWAVKEWLAKEYGFVAIKHITTPHEMLEELLELLEIPKPEWAS